jgi:hypothetical protein
VPTTAITPENAKSMNVIAAYQIPVDKVERGLSARRAADKSGRQLLSGVEPEYAKHHGVEDLTGLMMEFSSTHGTALYAQLRHAVKASPNIRRVKGSARVLEPGSTLVGALVEDKPVTIAARAIILATGEPRPQIAHDNYGLASSTGSPVILALETQSSRCLASS